MKRPRPTGRVVDNDEVLRIRAVCSDGTDIRIPFMAMGRSILRFEVNETIYAPIARRDYDDLGVLE